MRTAVLIAAPMLVAGLLVAGCSQSGDDAAGPAVLTPITPSHPVQRTPRSSTGATATVAAKAPESSASASDAIAWVQAAQPADSADFRVALRGGVSTSIGEDVAFTTPFGTQCMTDVKRSATDLACLVALADPPKAPPDVYGVWKGGWVDFDGSVVRIGSAHGDPGRFAVGRGVPLPTDRSLSFGDYRCRNDATTLVCVNYARQTAVRYADDAVTPFGCTRQTPPDAGVGIQYRC